MPDDEHWSVTLALPPEDLEALRIAIADVVPSERHAIITELFPEGAEGDSELVVDVFAGDKDEAIDDAADTYRRARARAGLPDQPPEIIGLLPPMFAGEVYDRLWREAEELQHQGRDELAVIRAQTACECLAREALAGLLRSRVGRERAYLADAVVMLCRPTLNDKRTQQLVATVTGGRWRMTSEPWWREYHAHLQRRNGIVHRGLSIRSEDAVASLEAVSACMHWLRWMWADG